MLKYGDVIAFKPTTTYGSAISLFDGSPYSHVGMFLKYEKGIPLFIESHEKKGGVVISKLHEWGNYDVYRPIDIKPRPMKDMLDKLGTPYDGSMILHIIMAKTFRREQANNDFSRVICSEFIDYGYRYKVGNGLIATPNTFYSSKHFVKINE